MVRTIRMAAFVASVLVGASQAAFGQATASINGRVVDQAGAVLPGANITVTNTQTNATRETTTNGDGLYSLPALLPGIYSVKAQLEGFGPQVRNDITLLIGAAVTVDMQLGVAQLQENLTVTGDAPMIETTQSVLASSIRQVEV